MNPPLTHRTRNILIGIAAILIIGLIAGRLYLNVWVLNYVNTSLHNLKAYEGSVEGIDLALYRGAYRIHNLKIVKRDSHIPAPFLAIETTDLSIQWGALLHGRIVSDITLVRPQLNFAVNHDERQTGAEEDWTKAIKDLAPIDINVVTLQDGKLTYQDFSSNPKVDIFIHHLQGEVRNLRNVVDKTQKLPSTIHVRGDSIGGGAFETKGRMNILKQLPDMDLNTKLENVSLPALNNYSNAYAALDFKHGNLSIYSQLIITDEKVSGYVKPIAKHISVEHFGDANPLKVAWSAVASTIITIFTNQRTDQFATKADLDGNLHNINTDPWSAVGGIISNAFVSAVKKGFDSSGKGELLPEEKK